MSTIELDAFLADSVASVQGKLYALGAGWNRIAVALFPLGTTVSGSGSCSDCPRVRPTSPGGSSSGCTAPRTRSSRSGRVRRVR